MLPKLLGPFCTIDVDSGRPLRMQALNDLAGAFNRGDTYLADNPDKDFLVLDAAGTPVARSRCLSH